MSTEILSKLERLVMENSTRYLYWGPPDLMTSVCPLRMTDAIPDSYT